MLELYNDYFPILMNIYNKKIRTEELGEIRNVELEENGEFKRIRESNK